MNPPDSGAEWLEADGLGGFASGTVSGIRTRRYHALLLTATTPPAGRMVLVNGFDAWVETPDGTFAISSQRYAPDVVHPNGAARIESFEYEPWPRWRYRLTDDLIIEQEIFVPHGQSAVFISWRVVAGGADPGGNGPGSTLDQPGSTPPATTLKVRPFFSGRDFHSTHHENGSFRFQVDVSGERATYRPYDGVPAVVAFSNGDTRTNPPGIGIFFMPKNRRAGLMPLRTSLRLAS